MADPHRDHTERQRAAAINSAAARDDVLRAIDGILRRNNHQPANERGPIGLEILAAFTGRGWQPPEPAAAQCPLHPNTKPDARGNCPTCGPKGI